MKTWTSSGMRSSEKDQRYWLAAWKTFFCTSSDTPKYLHM